MAKNYYIILGISRGATADEIKKAYRKKAMEFHPDRNHGSKASEEKFKEVLEAYNALSGGNSGSSIDWDEVFRTKHNGNGRTYESSKKWEEMFGSMFGGFDFNDINMGGGFGKAHNRKKQGGNISISIDVTIEDIMSCAKKTIKYERFEQCSVCKGEGAKCSSCQNGVVKKDHVATFNIPPNCYKVSTSIYKDHGHQSRDGLFGDLVVSFSILRHENYDLKIGKFRGLDISCKLYIGLIDIIYGTTIDFTSINGEILKLYIPPGSSYGKGLRVNGKGVNGGDLLIIFVAYTPSPNELTVEDVEKLKSIDNLNKIFIKRNARSRNS